MKFAEDNHWNVEEEDIFIDVISGFKKGEFRPEYAKMLERVEYGDIDIILFSLCIYPYARSSPPP